jgi:hypothetical protein
MKGTVVALLIAMFVSIGMSADAWAQATAQISGTVTDQSGAVLPGVEINVTHTGTGIARGTITNETGSYVLPNLPIGPYRLEASLPGFRTSIQTGIVLEVNSSPAINVIMEVGQVTEAVEVQANATLVETRNAGIGQVVENARILELPLNGRAVVELVALAGAAAPAPTLTGSERDPFVRGNVSVAGGLNSGLLYILDGANHNNPFQGSYLSMPFPDAMQEFKVETSATSATQGVKSSGTVSLVTKSGTNEFHGNLFEFVRNYKFNARNAFSPARDTMKRNQFGGTIGGPIARNKLFFFAGYQGTRIRQDPPTSLAFVPTAAMLAGDFRAVTSPACNAGRQITLSAPFVDNQVDQSLLSAPALKFSSFLPKSDDPCGRLNYSNPDIDDWENVIGRVDYQMTASHSLFGRYLLETRLQPVGYDINKNLLSAGNGVDGFNQALTVGSTYLFGSNIVNTFRVTYNDFDGGKTGADFSDCKCGNGHLGINSFFPEPDQSAITVTGGFGVGASTGPTYMKLYGFNDDVSVIRGNHQMSFGVSAAYWWIDSGSSANTEYRFTFNGRFYGLGLADYLLGRASLVRTGSAIEQHNRSKYFNLYAADTWQVHRSVALSYGVRWEPFFPQINIDGTSIHFDEAALRQGIKTQRFDNAPPGLFFDGDPGFPDRQGMNNQWGNIAPRLGLAWDVSGDGRTSVRASAGLFYDHPAAIYFRNLTTVPPWSIRTQLADVSFRDPWANYPGGDPGQIPYGGDAPKNVPWQLNSIVTALDYDTPNMRVGSFNLSVQRQIGTDWMVSASYLGNATRHLWGTQPINPVFFVPGVGDANGNCLLNGQVVPYKVSPGAACSAASTASYNARRRLSLDPSIPTSVSRYLGPVNRVDSGGTASYNGLLVSVQRRPVRGVSVSGNYTWSHCITDLWQEVANPQNADEGYVNWNNRNYDRGNCTTGATDRRHVFNLSGAAETPQFANRALGIIASGWRFSPILRLLSGSNLTVTDNRDRALNFMLGQRPDLVLSNPYGDKSVNNYLNPAAFAQPAIGALGNLGRASIKGPDTWQFDVALSRGFQFAESQRIEFRAEAFNLTNSFRMDSPSTALNSSTFGQVTTAQDPRIMQFALKYFF